MKNLVKNALTVLVATLMLSALPTDAEAEIYNDTIRLHILANSDSTDDQNLKLEIRDKLLLEYGSFLTAGDSIDEAKCLVEEIIPKMERDCATWISEMGYSYDVKISLDEEWYDTREYEDFALPCGIYTSLKVIIGGGEGKNWWCVMYPPLCMELATENAPVDDGVIDYSKEEIKLIKGGKYNVKFKILEGLSKAFAKNG